MIPYDVNQKHIVLAYQKIEKELSHIGIKLILTRKRVKNINFRLKPDKLNVSVPIHLSNAAVVKALEQRFSWFITQHAILKQRDELSQNVLPQSPLPNNKHLQKTTLWGEVQPLTFNEVERIEFYRHALKTVMPDLFAKWQPIVGKTAKEMRIKKMKTRWGSCNIRHRRVWLSVYLPAYPIECTEYVIVHELCHLHHANHSPKFWYEVQRAMPDYQHWHDILANKVSSIQTDKM